MLFALPRLPVPTALLPADFLPSDLLPATVRARVYESLARRRVPDFRIPPALARVAARLPQQVPAQMLVTALNLALDRILPRADLQPLCAHHLQMQVSDAGLTLDFTLTEKGFARIRRSGKPDLIISASTRDYLALALREEDPDSLFFSRRLRMEGDTDLGLLVKNTLDAVDWEALKTRFLGTPAPG